jgi:hypothetical protein
MNQVERLVCRNQLNLDIRVLLDKLAELGRLGSKADQEAARVETPSVDRSSPATTISRQIRAK